MTVDILKLLNRFDSRNDRESDSAYFRTFVPWVGSEAYLNVVYKGAPEDALEQVSKSMLFPHSLVQMLKEHNGAKLFSEALCLFGVHREGQLLNRSEPFFNPTFNIVNENGYGFRTLDRYFAIGFYCADGTRPVIDRDTGQVFLMTPQKEMTSINWPTLDAWLASEIERIGMLYTDEGKLLAALSETVPNRTLIM